MKYPNGTFKEWASNVTEREHYENQILYTYYCKINEAFIICFKILIFSIFFLNLQLFIHSFLCSSFWSYHLSIFILKNEKVQYSIRVHC